jgi:hypothetical protein
LTQETRLLDTLDERQNDGLGEATRRLAEIANGLRVSQALYVAAELRIADLIVHKPLTGQELAAITETDASALTRLLRALCAFGVFSEDGAGKFNLNMIGEALRSDVPGSFRAAVLFMAGPVRWRCWGELFQTVRTGINRPEAMFGMQLFDFYARHPSESKIQADAMRALSTSHMNVLVEALPLRGYETIVDVGGGTGEFLAAILKKHPGARGILFDLPNVVEQAPTVLAPARVSDRCEVLAGSFFDTVPDGGDVYLLKQIIHDWDDKRTVEILRACRASMTDRASLIVIERRIPEAIGLGTVTEPFLADLEMLVMTPGGRERTEGEVLGLFRQAGLRHVHTVAGKAYLALFQADART